MEYIFKPPSYEKMTEKINQSVDILSGEGLQPVSYEESDKLLSELKSETKANKEDKD
jgi:hypothetical protein